MLDVIRMCSSVGCNQGRAAVFDVIRMCRAGMVVGSGSSIYASYMWVYLRGGTHKSKAKKLEAGRCSMCRGVECRERFKVLDVITDVQKCWM